MARLGREAWVSLVAEFEASGLSQRGFAAERRLSVHTLQFWIYKLRGKRPGPRFVPIQVIARRPLLPSPVTTERSGVEVVLGSGTVLRVPVGTDPRYVAALVAELG